MATSAAAPTSTRTAVSRGRWNGADVVSDHATLRFAGEDPELVHVRRRGKTEAPELLQEPARTPDQLETTCGPGHGPGDGEQGSSRYRVEETGLVDAQRTVTEAGVALMPLSTTLRVEPGGRASPGSVNEY